MAVAGADAEAGVDPKRDEPKAGAEEAVVAEKGDEPNAGAGDEPNAGAGDEEKADGAVEKEKGEEDEIVRRKEVYAEKARGYKGGDGDIRVPQWVLYSVLAGVLGYILVSSRVGQKLRWWMR